jgi:hypothetical protein
MALSNAFAACIGVLVALLPFTAAGAEKSAEPDGLTVIRRAIAASGGATWQQPKTLWLKGDATFTPYGRTDAASRLEFDDYTMYRVFPTENTAAHQANGKVRFDARHGKQTFMQLIFDGRSTNSHLSEAAKPYQKHFSWSNNFGFGILRFADQEGFKVERLADDQVEGIDCHVVQITDPKKMVTTFSIDRKSNLIRGVAFTTDVGFHQRIYSEFSKAPNVDFVQPGRVRLYFVGIKWMDIRWRQFKVNEPIADSVFQAAN